MFLIYEEGYHVCFMSRIYPRKEIPKLTLVIGCSQQDFLMVVTPLPCDH